MRPISCFRQEPSARNILTDGFARGGSEKYPVRDVIFSVGARNDSRVLSLMSALPVNAELPRERQWCGGFSLEGPAGSRWRADLPLGFIPRRPQTPAR